MSKMIEIRGKQYSEDTIVEALKKHADFEEKPYQFEAGDVIQDQDDKSDIRIIIDIDNELRTLHSWGKTGMTAKEAQEEGDGYTFRKIGVLSDFLKGE